MARRALAVALFVSLGLSAPFGGQSRAGELSAPSGPVVLTIAGQIGVANRGPSDAELDPILIYHEISFAAAAEFDRAMLESLGTHEIELSYEKWSEVYRVSGPRLVDVLSAVGAQGRAITVTAVDGYAVEVSAEELTARDWIVVLERNGRPLDIGGLGPLWIVYAVPGNTAGHDDVPRWPWAVFFIEVH
jgi:hypothetical protein